MQGGVHVVGTMPVPAAYSQWAQGLAAQKNQMNSARAGGDADAEHGGHGGDADRSGERVVCGGGAAADGGGVLDATMPSASLNRRHVLGAAWMC